MHEKGDHATKNQLTGLLLQGDGLEERLEQWECILHDQTGGSFFSGWRMVRFLTTILPKSAEKEGSPPPLLSPHTSKKQFKRAERGDRHQGWDGAALERAFSSQKRRPAEIRRWLKEQTGMELDDQGAVTMGTACD